MVRFVIASSFVPVWLSRSGVSAAVLQSSFPIVRFCFSSSWVSCGLSWLLRYLGVGSSASSRPLSSGSRWLAGAGTASLSSLPFPLYPFTHSQSARRAYAAEREVVRTLLPDNWPHRLGRCEGRNRGPPGVDAVRSAALTLLPVNWLPSVEHQLVRPPLVPRSVLNSLERSAGCPRSPEHLTLIFARTIPGRYGLAPRALCRAGNSVARLTFNSGRRHGPRSPVGLRWRGRGASPLRRATNASWHFQPSVAMYALGWSAFFCAASRKGQLVFPNLPLTRSPFPQRPRA